MPLAPQILKDVGRAGHSVGSHTLVAQEFEKIR